MAPWIRILTEVKSWIWIRTETNVSGKLTAAENQHKMVDPMKLFLHLNLLHHLAALVANQKVRVCRIEDLHFSLKLQDLLLM
jgi:hypothetical protein